jgi:hypothetical protein
MPSGSIVQRIEPADQGRTVPSAGHRTPGFTSPPNGARLGMSGTALACAPPRSHGTSPDSRDRGRNAVRARDEQRGGVIREG